MAVRVIMVEFNRGVTMEGIAEFQGWLRELAARVPYLVRMQCGPHRFSPAEQELSAHAPIATYGHFVSVWEFAEESDVTRFVAEPFHKDMASKRFKKLVKHRYVANIL